ncbi:hypothetical protein OsJ_34785 [Oryza sativa Japonica Group]|uniref:Uncharacterized protein n=2 Tax=Oryza sativa subsp. japonica TaxID=39947 RepID=A3CDT5_ORYSJ|nr:hypothetical protein OsJ_34785 [Oryza sativa Japonica Group]
MVSLPGRLEELVRRHGSKLPKGAEEEISLIKQDLEKIISVLHGHSEPKLEGQAMVVRCWMKEVRELSYDIEDCIDHYEHASAWSSIHRSKITRRRWSWTRGKRTPRLPERLKQRLWMANKIREFSTRSQEALQRHAMYNNLSGIASTAASSPCDASSSSSWHPGQDGKENGKVGIDSSVPMLKGWLTDGEKLKVVSIVGVGGVGKTTLANELYRKLQWQFECRAFVRTSQKTDMRRILISMLSQVRPQQPPDNWKVNVRCTYTPGRSARGRRGRRNKPRHPVPLLPSTTSPPPEPPELRRARSGRCSPRCRRRARAPPSSSTSPPWPEPALPAAARTAAAGRSLPHSWSSRLERQQDGAEGIAPASWEAAAGVQIRRREARIRAPHGRICCSGRQVGSPGGVVGVAGGGAEHETPGGRRRRRGWRRAGGGVGVDEVLAAACRLLATPAGGGRGRGRRCRGGLGDEVARSTSPAQTQRHSGACCSGGEAAGCGYVEERATPVWRRRRCLWRLAVAVAVAAAAAAAVAAMTTTAAAAVARWKEARWWCVSVAAAAVAVIVVTGDMTASTASRGRGRRLHLAGAASFGGGVGD